MRLTPEEIAKLPNPFMAIQALALAACDELTRKVTVMRADGTTDYFENGTDMVTLRPGDEVEILPRATSAGPGFAASSAIES